MCPRAALHTLIFLSIWGLNVVALPRYTPNERYNDGNVTFTTLNGLGEVVYRPEPIGRGTVGILVSCTATYIFCVWTSLRPNILPGSKKRARLWYKVVLAFLAILGPEGMMICAFGERRQAQKLKDRWDEVRTEEHKQRNEERPKKQGTEREKEDEKAKERKELWEATAKFPREAAFFVVMGGFLINSSRIEKVRTQDVSGAQEVQHLTLLNNTPDYHPPPFRMGSVPTTTFSHIEGQSYSGLADVMSEDRTEADCISPHLSPTSDKLATVQVDSTSAEVDPPLEPGDYLTILTPTGFLYYVNNHMIDENSFDRGAMADKGKANMVGKILAFGQALWLMVQSLGRWRNDPQLPLTLLEVHVLLQLACAGFTYLCWWHKPLDVAEPIVVRLNHSNRPEDNSKLMFNKVSDIQARFYESKANNNPHFLTTRKSETTTLTIMLKAFFDVTSQLSAKIWNGNTTPLFVEGFLFIAAGGLHFVALRVDFSTTTEQVLWKAACSAMVALPLVIVTILYFTKYHEEQFRVIWEVPFGAMKGDTFLVYLAKKTQSYFTHRRNKWTRTMAKGPWRTFSGRCCILFDYILACVCIILLVLLLLSSLYLTVESYFAMRSPPAGTFQTPRWSDWLPHI